MNITLIGGTGRSGTNITKKILSKHSQIATLPFEHRFTIDPGGVVDFYNSWLYNWTPFYADKKLKDFQTFLLSLANESLAKKWINAIIKKIDKKGKKITPISYSGWELEKWFPGYKDSVLKLIDKLKDFEYSGAWPGSNQLSLNNRVWFGAYQKKHQLATILGGFLRELINSLLLSMHKQAFVEDNTWNILHGQELHEMLPEAKFIYVVRDPRDVIASFVKQRWCPDNVNQAIIWYQSIMNKTLASKNNLEAQCLLELKLEDLVKEKEAVIKQVCGFIEIPFEKELLQVDLSKSHSGRWEQQFSKEDQVLINQELAYFLELYNYQ